MNYKVSAVENEIGQVECYQSIFNMTKSMKKSKSKSKKSSKKAKDVLWGDSDSSESEPESSSEYESSDESDGSDES